MPIDPKIIERLTPQWRAVDTAAFGPLLVRSPTVADAARAPASGWWLSCVRLPDHSPAFEPGFDIGQLDAVAVSELQQAVLSGNPTPPPTGG